MDTLLPQIGVQENGVQPSGLNVLILDDDLDCADSTATLLGLFGHNVQIARNGLTAVSAVITDRFDVVLLDIGLPGMNGYDFARWLKSLNLSTRPFVIVVSGYGADKAKVNSVEYGIDLFLLKPADPVALKELLESRAMNHGRLVHV